jgi:amino acid transporter
MVAWVVVSICSIRFHAAVKAQNSNILSGKYAYRAWLWPAAPIFLGVTAFLVLIGLFAEALFPVGGAAPNAYDFFQTYLGVPIVLVAYLGFKVIFKTKFRKANEIDLVTGHEPLTAEQEAFLDKYYAQTMWQRIWSYVSTTD